MAANKNMEKSIQRLEARLSNKRRAHENTKERLSMADKSHTAALRRIEKLKIENANILEQAHNCNQELDTKNQELQAQLIRAQEVIQNLRAIADNAGVYAHSCNAQVIEVQTNAKQANKQLVDVKTTLEVKRRQSKLHSQKKMASAFSKVTSNVGNEGAIVGTTNSNFLAKWPLSRHQLTGPFACRASTSGNPNGTATNMIYRGFMQTHTIAAQPLLSSHFDARAYQNNYKNIYAPKPTGPCKIYYRTTEK
ncbi:hypothetical protein H4R20_002835 [Coemansia guatemalensis]|uniref:Uncharacterized protein n=1 Tax=Coemansia guatemalensis TaxID=2761395 RepID=A0A9W8HZ88_9FUNG|nr:hypothetical protein H4R20_002835 [Coemansia guatemalensis]